MKKTEFLNKLREELEKRNVADAADILEEYEQHFDLKLADGFFEEEIAARLGDLPAGRAEYPRTAARHALLVRRDSGVESAGAYGAVRSRLRLLRCIPAAADPLLRALPAQRDGQRVRFGRAAAAAHQPAVFRQSKAPPARR